MFPDQETILADLDPGIRDVVQLLWAHGFTTTDSGDGVTKYMLYGDDEALTAPHVAITTNPDRLFDDAERLRDALVAEGITLRPGQIQASYDPVDDSCVLLLLDVNDEALDDAALEGTS